MFIGSGVAIITPMHGDGSINVEVFCSLIDYHIENKTDAIIVAGTTGESSTLSEVEHMELVKIAVEYASGRIPIIAGTGSNDTNTALELSLLAQEYGADAVLLINPYYNKSNRSGLIAHFETVANILEIPIILYNVPGRTGQSIPVDVVLHLAKHKNIVGYKEASGDLDYLMELMAKVPNDFYVYSGNDDQVLVLMALGGKGVISVAANIIPNEMHDMVHSYLSGNIKRSRELQYYYYDLIKSLFIEVNPIPIKEAMNILGYNSGPTRLPLGIMDEANYALLKAALERYMGN